MAGNFSFGAFVSITCGLAEICEKHFWVSPYRAIEAFILAASEPKRWEVTPVSLGTWVGQPQSHGRVI